MCVDFTGKLRTTTRTIIAYKVLLHRRSPVHGRATLQPGWPKLGKTLHYPKGSTVKSPMPETPGIYLFREKTAGGFCGDIVKVRIPVGAQIQLGIIPNWRPRYKTPTINASEIQVLE